MRNSIFGLILTLTALILFIPPLQASERGSQTNLPIPRFVSLKTDTGNVRRGPSLNHRIDWVFKRRNMPLKVIDEYGHWRRVTDRDDEGGWVHHSLLSGTRTVIIQDDLMPIYARADPSTLVNAHLQAGVVARLRKCTRDWCQISGPLKPDFGALRPMNCATDMSHAGMSRTQTLTNNAALCWICLKENKRASF